MTVVERHGGFDAGYLYAVVGQVEQDRKGGNPHPEALFAQSFARIVDK